MPGWSTAFGEHRPAPGCPGWQVGRSGSRAYVEKRPLRRFSLMTRDVDFSSSTSRPWASLVATWTPCSEERSCPGTVHERVRSPSRVHSKTFDGSESPAGFVYVPAYTRPFGCT